MPLIAQTRTSDDSHRLQMFAGYKLNNCSRQDTLNG